MLANSELAKGRTNPGQNRALALLLKYLWPSEAPSVPDDPCFGFQFKLANLKPLMDDAKRRLELERALNDQTAKPKSPAPSLQDVLKANQNNKHNSACL